jgi:hypothetical protein
MATEVTKNKVMVPDGAWTPSVEYWVCWFCR